MNGLTRLRSSIQRTFFRTKDPNVSSWTTGQEECSTLNHQFASYERFDLATGQQKLEISLETLNPSTRLSTPNSVIGTNEDNVDFLPKNCKRTLHTISSVFCPVALSMFTLSIFMRVNFALAHAGVFQTLLQLSICFVILFCTLLSVCSLATNGAIDSGGVYHMISRALGPEFGGAIGVLFFAATVIGNGQSVVALVEALVVRFGPETNANLFHGTRWWRFLYGTSINLLSLTVCLVGSSLFSTAAFFIFILVCCIYLMVVVSFFVQDPLRVLIPKANTFAYHEEALLDNKTDFLYGDYTGFSSETWKGNLYSNYTIDYTTGGTMDFATVFGILFSSVTGLLSGATMSGELKQPSRNISGGSISAMVFVFFTYVTETLLIAGTTDRYILLNNYSFLSDINIWEPLVIIGIIFAVFSACISGLIGASRILEAVSKDEIFGVLLRWIRSGTTRRGNPVVAVLCSFILVEIILLTGSLNRISPVVTIFFLLAYFAVNISCLALELASAPNFRPTFKYFSWHTALIGAVGSIIMCFIVSALFASIAIGILTTLITVLHLRDFPRPSWGSISQALIFHQVRKYLLLLDPRKEHVKFWRPQMLLLVSNPRSAIHLIDFVNDMKKGGLFIIGHVKIDPINGDSNDSCIQELPHWNSLIDQMKIKAFVDMTSAATIRDGLVQLMRLSGLGGLRPNTVILGFYDQSIPEDQLHTRSFYKRRWLRSNLTKQQQHSFQSGASTITFDSLNSSASTNTNDIYSVVHFPKLREENEEKGLDVNSYVQIIRDTLCLNKSICLARNFSFLQREDLNSKPEKVFIDIWPVNFIFPDTSIQFDVTCLYMLQLATIISMVKPWKTRAMLRVFLCLDAINENSRRTQYNLNELLGQLRIKAQTRIVSWENVTSLLNKPSTTDQDAATIPLEQQSPDTPVINSFIDVNDEYIRAINELIRQQCDNTACLYLYLPRPPCDTTLSQRYVRVLDMLSNDLPPIMFVHGVSSVTCTQL